MCRDSFKHSLSCSLLFQASCSDGEYLIHSAEAALCWVVFWLRAWKTCQNSHWSSQRHFSSQLKESVRKHANIDRPHTHTHFCSESKQKGDSEESTDTMPICSVVNTAGDMQPSIDLLIYEAHANMETRATHCSSVALVIAPPNNCLFGYRATCATEQLS